MKPAKFRRGDQVKFDEGGEQSGKVVYTRYDNKNREYVYTVQNDHGFRGRVIGGKYCTRVKESECRNT